MSWPVRSEHESSLQWNLKLYLPRLLRLINFVVVWVMVWYREECPESQGLNIHCREKGESYICFSYLGSPAVRQTFLRAISWTSDFALWRSAEKLSIVETLHTVLVYECYYSQGVSWVRNLVGVVFGIIPYSSPSPLFWEMHTHF
jgi:hypothetical protein